MFLKLFPFLNRHDRMTARNQGDKKKQGGNVEEKKKKNYIFFKRRIKPYHNECYFRKERSFIACSLIKHSDYQCIVHGDKREIRHMYKFI